MEDFFFSSLQTDPNVVVADPANPHLPPGTPLYRAILQYVSVLKYGDTREAREGKFWEPDFGAAFFANYDILASAEPEDTWKIGCCEVTWDGSLNFTTATPFLLIELTPGLFWSCQDFSQMAFCRGGYEERAFCAYFVY